MENMSLKIGDTSDSMSLCARRQRVSTVRMIISASALKMANCGTGVNTASVVLDSLDVMAGRKHPEVARR